MRDDFLGQDWAKHHESFSADIHKLFTTMAVGFARLNAYQFDAPWKHDAKCEDATTR